MRGLWVLTIGLICQIHSAGQVGTATIVGQALDSNGARIPRAKVELRSERSSSNVHRTETDERGDYLFEGLLADEYALEISSPGFQTLRVRSIAISDREHRIMPDL